MVMVIMIQVQQTYESITAAFSYQFKPRRAPPGLGGAEL